MLRSAFLLVKCTALHCVLGSLLPDLCELVWKKKRRKTWQNRSVAGTSKQTEDMNFNWSILTALIRRQRSGWKIIIKHIHMYKSLDQWMNDLSLNPTMSNFCFLYPTRHKNSQRTQITIITASTEQTGVMFPFYPMLSHFLLCHATFNMVLCLCSH